MPVPITSYHGFAYPTVHYRPERPICQTAEAYLPFLAKDSSSAIHRMRIDRNPGKDQPTRPTIQST